MPISFQTVSGCRAPFGSICSERLTLTIEPTSRSVLSEIRISPPVVYDSIRPVRLTALPTAAYFIRRVEEAGDDVVGHVASERLAYECAVRLGGLQLRQIVRSADDAADRARAAADHRAREQDRDLPAVVNLVDGLTTADPSVPEHF